MSEPNSVAEAVMRVNGLGRIWTSPNGVDHAVSSTGWCATCGRFDHPKPFEPGDRITFMGTRPATGEPCEIHGWVTDSRLTRDSVEWLTVQLRFDPGREVEVRRSSII